ncbi:hypothetical protein DdX_20491 [Ditylenchus destructor]|uniref:Uncharacterized protein n=1 Tax=Ditylenchus destructor TaxID=166010 RepID=A0AAD4MGI5_9BILA|nr:hypothetical protein DdX_20491 [Ditylenchus destructor]
MNTFSVVFFAVCIVSTLAQPNMGGGQNQQGSPSPFGGMSSGSSGNGPSGSMGGLGSNQNGGSQNGGSSMPPFGGQ